MIETIQYLGVDYPAFQAEGNAARWCREFALEICKPFEHTGYDIGFCKDAWKLPNAIGVDINLNNGYDAMTLPALKVDFIHSSHCLEHLPNWVDALDYWTSKLKPLGVLFLYLPHPKQKYWLPFHNRKHVHSISPELIREYLESTNEYHKIFVSECDANHSFIAFAEKI